MASINRLPLTLIFSLLPLISALQVTPGSTCAPLCLDMPDGKTDEAASSSIIPEDIVCGDSEYATSKAGKKFVSCLDCLQTSTAVDGAENDVAWYLYNLRYAVDECLFSPNSTKHSNTTSSKSERSTECDVDAKCGPLKTALQSNIKSPSNETEYEYCLADNRAFQGKAAGECVQCLRSTTDRAYLSNFMTALQAGCQQQPAPGVLLGLSGTVFQLSAVNITGSATSSSSSNSPGPVLTLGAIIGIAVGGAVLFLLSAILFIIYWRRQRGYRLEDQARKTQYPTVHLSFPPPGGPMTGGSSLTVRDHFLTSPNYTTDYKTKSPDPEASRDTFEKHFASNAEYYDQMSNHGSAHGHGISDATTIGAAESVAAMPAHPAYIPRTMARPSRTDSPKQRIGLPSEPRPAARAEDSYTLQQYLASGEEPTGPPPNNPPSARSIPRSFASGPASPPSRSAVPLISPPARSLKSPPVTSVSAHQPAEQLASPPMSGGVGSKAPSIHSNVSVVPSLILPDFKRKNRRNRGANAAAKFEAAVGGGLTGRDISAPISEPQERFVDGRVSRMGPGAGEDDGKIVERTLVRPTVRGYQEVPIASGKSFLYG